ncbi:MAG TPA: hypothetical protein VGR92_11460 [Steroidobacteraceae bacterium]|nr:hypothetical protein [Steroidobacteraceae bacterium]
MAAVAEDSFVDVLAAGFDAGIRYDECAGGRVHPVIARSSG